MNKYCKKCNNTKNISEFDICKSKKDGLQSYCKNCKRNFYLNRSKMYEKKQSVTHIDGEIWKDIVNYEGYYQVSNFGRIKSMDRLISCGKKVFHKREFIMKISNNPDGYPEIVFHKNGIKKTISVHRVIAEAFIPKIDGKPYINHKNGIRNDNRIENLEWCTQQENVQHGYTHNGRVGPNKGGTRPDFKNSKSVYCITNDTMYCSINEAAKKLSLTRMGISNVCEGKQKHTQKYIFKYHEKGVTCKA